MSLSTLDDVLATFTDACQPIEFGTAFTSTVHPHMNRGAYALSAVNQNDVFVDAVKAVHSIDMNTGLFAMETVNPN